LYEILRRCEVRIADSTTLRRYSAPELAKWVLELTPSADQIAEKAKCCNKIADLAILLEPLYWPRITGQENYGMSEEQHDAQLNEYRPKAMRLVETLDLTFWREAHKWLRIGAAGMDDNPSLYLLLRLANWSRREKLKGRIAGALWIRHIAEVIRRAFEDVHGERWPEEDQSFGHWPSGARTRIFGSDRPLDNVLLSKPYLAQHFELFTGSATRWYVEGKTEYYSILQIIPEPWKIGLEIKDLHGTIESGRDNTALRLEGWLQDDQSLRRFSIISFDKDVPVNVRAIRRQCELNRVIGLVAAHEPDFEFANFAIDELVEVAARVDESHGFPGGPVRTADWSGVTGAHAFEARYCSVSEKKPSSLKGEEWGRSLASYATEYPHRSDDGSERPLWRQIRAAVNGWCSNYDYQREHFVIDPITFGQVPKPEVAKPPTS
jgi:hypothetical protein